MLRTFFGLVAVLIIVLITGGTVAEAATRISADSRALLSVITSAQSTPRVQSAAKTLAEYLGRISGAPFERKNGDGKTGIAVGTAADFPALSLAKEFDAQNPMRREEYILRSHAAGVLLIGATELAVEHAIWDLLHRLGYRQFFPGANWEIVPSTPDLVVAFDSKEQPDFNARRIWFTYGTWKENEAAMQKWNARNRMAEGFRLNTGHAYDEIIAAKKEEFRAHPEYLSGGNKFNIAQPGLRKLVVDYALEYFAKNPNADSISLDPSDGGGWSNAPEEQKLGSVSNRVTLLANEVAEAVNKKYKDKYVAFYAYHFHSPPPTVSVHPKVLVSVATAFIKGGYSADQLIEGWKKQGATIGVREYYSIIHWDKDLPRRASAGNLPHIANSIASFHRRGARFLSAESSDNWGPAGLGYYLASRVMWDTKEAGRLDEIVDDFFAKAFGPARTPMEEYYGLLYVGLDSSRKMPLSSDFIGRLYRSLDAALKMTDDTQIQSRIGDLVQYTRFIELYETYRTSRGAERQAAFETMLRHAYRIRSSHMVHSLAQWRVASRDKSITIPREAGFKIAEEKNPWKSSEPFRAEEIARLVTEGIANNSLFEFTPIDFSTDLVPATPLQLPPVEPGKFNMTRGGQTYFTWIAPEKNSVSLQISSGHTYGNRGQATVRLMSVVKTVAADDAANDENIADENEGELPEVEKPELLDQASAAPDKALHEVTLKSSRTGLHRIELQDNKMGTNLSWPASTPVAIISSASARTAIWGNWSAYFYVPKGTKNMGGFIEGRAAILDSDGRKAHESNGKLEYFNLPVKPGQDGKLWKYSGKGQLGLMTVPPYLALRADELLLPREVIEADKQ